MNIGFYKMVVNFFKMFVFCVRVFVHASKDNENYKNKKHFSISNLFCLKVQ